MLLRYTGHPILDVGVATLVAFANRDNPQELTEADLDSIADYMAANYTKEPLRGFLTVAFPNSGYTQPAYFKQPDKQETYKRNVLRAYRSDQPVRDELDVFLGLPAAGVPLDVDGKLPPGRVFRQHLPLQTGEEVINFHPGGEAGLPISGLALLAFQAYPLGSAKCGGRTLSIHSDDPEIMQHFARRFLEENLRAISLARQAGSSKMPEPDQKYRTLVVSTLLDARRMQAVNLSENGRPFSLSIYHMTNSGQGVDLDIYHLSSQIIGYLQEMLSADYLLAWQRIVREAWEKPALKKGQTEPPADHRPPRNHLYEDLFVLAQDVPRSAGAFIRKYFLPATLRTLKQSDPSSDPVMRRDSQPVSWRFVTPFLRRIMLMDPVRIEQIRSLADSMAAYIRQENDQRFFRRFFMLERYPELRRILINANTAFVRAGHPPFLTFDVFIGVFEEGEELARHDWQLARDLLLIRLTEQLYANGWLGAHGESLVDAAQEEAE